jgi:hypothetical protein
VSDIGLSDLPWVDAGGERRYLANLPAPVRYSWPVYGDVPQTPLVPREEWAGLVPDETPLLDPWLQYVHDQDGIGLCNAAATAAAIEDMRAQAGLPFVALSGGDLYNRICGGVDRGSLLEDGLAAAMVGGVAPVSVTPYLQWRGRGPGAAEAAKAYRVLEAYLCPTFAHCASAVLNGFRLISGIMWYGNYTPDSAGWLPERRQGGGGGHAVMGYRLCRRGSTYGIAHKNSWTPRWGLAGRCVFPESAYEGPVGGWWAVRVVTQEAGTLPAPKFLEAA